jgi:hypothetical protein
VEIGNEEGDGGRVGLEENRTRAGLGRQGCAGCEYQPLRRVHTVQNCIPPPIHEFISTAPLPPPQLQQHWNECKRRLRTGSPWAAAAAATTTTPGSDSVGDSDDVARGQGEPDSAEMSRAVTTGGGGRRAPGSVPGPGPAGPVPVPCWSHGPAARRDSDAAGSSGGGNGAGGVLQHFANDSDAPPPPAAAARRPIRLAGSGTAACAVSGATATFASVAAAAAAAASFAASVPVAVEAQRPP